MPAFTTRPLLQAFQRKAQADLVEQMAALPFRPSIRGAVADGFADGYRAAQRDLLDAGVLLLDPDHEHEANGQDAGECPECVTADDARRAADARIAATAKRGRK